MTLELRHVTVAFPDGEGTVTALDDVSLTVGRGELLAVTGPSGSGKSTLLAVAGLLLTPSKGTVIVGGTDVTGASAARRTDLRRERIGLVFQQPHLLGALTAAEQLEMVSRLSPRRTPDGSGSVTSARRRALGLLDAVGLREVAHRRPDRLSGGQRQRVGIARALMNDPQLLLVDEPTSALDHERGVAIIGLLRRITQERGIATVVVTHDLGTLRDTDEVAVLRDGVLAAAARPGPYSGASA